MLLAIDEGEPVSELFVVFLKRKPDDGNDVSMTTHGVCIDNLIY
jgi:hypothetical protein